MGDRHGLAILLERLRDSLPCTEAAAKLAEEVTRVQLTPRELATLRLLADGKANKEIASELGVSERTVKIEPLEYFGIPGSL